MAEGFDDNEMQDLGEQYPEYNDMELDDLDNEYDDLSRERLHFLALRDEYQDPNRLDEVKERLRYIENLKKARNSATTVPDRRTVTIVRKTQRSSSAPNVHYTSLEDRPIITTTNAIQDFIQKIIMRILDLILKM